MAKPKKSLQQVAAEVETAQKPKRTAKRKAIAVEASPTTVYQFRGAGTMLRKGIYVTPEEWAAIQTARKASGESATTIIRRAICNDLGLELKR